MAAPRSTWGCRKLVFRDEAEQEEGTTALKSMAPRIMAAMKEPKMTPKGTASSVLVPPLGSSAGAEGRERAWACRNMPGQKKRTRKFVPSKQQVTRLRIQTFGSAHAIWSASSSVFKAWARAMLTSDLGGHWQ